MEDVVKIASYICARFQKEFGHRIDEMKLHKMLYLLQREVIIQRGEPLFEEQFEAWRYGPVSYIVHQYYYSNTLHEELPARVLSEYEDIFDYIFKRYASKPSWSLSTLTHGEYSWQNARKGLKPEDHCKIKIKTSDIRIDAERIKARRQALKLLGVAAT